MIAYGVERQKISVLGFAPSRNATSHRIRLEARSNANRAPHRLTRASPR
ncbi:hypothetical protein ABZW32_10040 [Streptomyces sp. NPDC004667]